MGGVRLRGCPVTCVGGGNSCKQHSCHDCGGGFVIREIVKCDFEGGSPQKKCNLGEKKGNRIWNLTAYEKGGLEVETFTGLGGERTPSESPHKNHQNLRPVAYAHKNTRRL